MQALRDKCEESADDVRALSGLVHALMGALVVVAHTHFCKMVVDVNDPQDVQALAFLMPNEDLSGRNVEDFLTAIRRIEELTGLDFLSVLPEATQSTVEASAAPALW